MGTFVLKAEELEVVSSIGLFGVKNNLTNSDVFSSGTEVATTNSDFKNYQSSDSYSFVSTYETHVFVNVFVLTKPTTIKSFNITSTASGTNSYVVVRFSDGSEKSFSFGSSANINVLVEEPFKNVEKITHNSTIEHAGGFSSLSVTSTIVSGIKIVKPSYSSGEAVFRFDLNKFLKLFTSSSLSLDYKNTNVSSTQELKYSVDGITYTAVPGFVSTTNATNKTLTVGSMDSYKANEYFYLKFSFSGTTTCFSSFELVNLTFTYTDLDVDSIVHKQDTKSIIKYYKKDMLTVSNTNVENVNDVFKSNSKMSIASATQYTAFSINTVGAISSYVLLSKTFNFAQVKEAFKFVDTSVCQEYRRDAGMVSLSITYSDNSVENIISEETTFNTPGGLTEVFVNPKPAKTIKSMTYSIYCKNTASSVNHYIYFWYGNWRAVYEAYSKILIKLPKKSYSNFLTIKSVSLNYDSTILNGTTGSVGIGFKQDETDPYVKSSIGMPILEQNIPMEIKTNTTYSSFPIKGLDKTKDLFLLFAFKTVDLNLIEAISLKLIDISIEGEVDVPSLMNETTVLDNYMLKTDVASNYMPITTVVDNYMQKSIVERDYRKIFFVNNAVATKGSFEDRIKLTWFTTDTAIKYNIYRKNPLGDFVKIGEVNDGKNTYYDMTAVKGTHYFYKISAVNSNSAESELTSEIEGYCNDIINSVKDVEATSGIYEDKVIVTWRNDPLADSYTIYRKKAAESGAQKVELGVVPKNTIIFEDTTVPTNEVYFYYVKATSTTLGDSPECHPDTGYRGIAKAGYRLGRFVVGDNKNNLIYDLGFKS